MNEINNTTSGPTENFDALLFKMRSYVAYISLSAVAISSLLSGFFRVYYIGESYYETSPIFFSSTAILALLVFSLITKKIDLAMTITFILGSATTYIRTFQLGIISSIMPSYFVLLILAYITKGRLWGVFSTIFHIIALTISIIKISSYAEPKELFFVTQMMIAIILSSISMYLLLWSSIKLMIGAKEAAQKQASLEIMYRLSHEIMNPLAIAKGYSQLFNDNHQHINTTNVDAITNSLDKIQDVVTKMAKYAVENNLISLVHANKDAINITDVIDKNV